MARIARHAFRWASPSITFWLLSAAVCVPAVFAPPAMAADPPLDQTITEDVPELLSPRRVRTELEEDLLTSGAHYAQARLLLQRDNKSLALKHFQRAWRSNFDRVELLDHVVALASELGRNEQAARYAVLSAERRPRDPRLLIQLGGLLTQQNETGRALRMYEKAVELQGLDNVTPRLIAIHIEMGRLYFLNDDFKNAARVFAVARDALDDPKVLTEAQRKQLMPKPHALYSLIAASFMEDGRFDEAGEAFKKADSFQSNQPELNFHLAEIAVRRKAFQDARKLLDLYLDAKSTAGGIEPYRLLRKLCEHENPDAEKADSAFVAEIRSRMKTDSKNIPLGYFWAGELLVNEKFDEAQRLYVDLLERQATGDAYVGLAKIYRHQTNVNRLLDIIERVVAQTESLEVLSAEVAQILEDRELAKKLIEQSHVKCKDASQATRLAAGLAAAHLAIEAKQFGEFDTFAQIAAEAAGDKKVEVLQQLGLTVFIAEDAKRATRLFQQALAEHPEEKFEASLQFYLAGAAQFAGDTEAALAAATRAAELRSDSPRFASRRPWILYQSKRHDQAEQQYLALLEKYEHDYDSPGVRNVVRESRSILSNMAVERQQYPEAEEWLAKVLDEFPEDIGAHNDLGYLWVDQGKHLHRATKMIQRAVEAEPKNIAYRDSLGWAYFRLGQFTDAVKELTIAAADDDADGVILDHLGDAHAGAGQPKEAITAWQKAQAAFQKAKKNDLLPAIEAKIKKHSKD